MNLSEKKQATLTQQSAVYRAVSKGTCTHSDRLCTEFNLWEGVPLKITAQLVQFVAVLAPQFKKSYAAILGVSPCGSGMREGTPESLDNGTVCLKTNKNRLNHVGFAITERHEPDKQGWNKAVWWMSQRKTSTRDYVSHTASNVE